MKMRYGLIQLFACAALLFGGNASPGLAQEECLQRVRGGVQPGVWATVVNWADSLRPDRRRTNRSSLIQLRSEIINYEIEKKRLIDIVEAHIHGRAAGSGVSEELRLSKIPDALQQIGVIAQKLRQIAGDSDLFAAENSFKELLVNFDAKRAASLCILELQARSPAPDLAVMITARTWPMTRAALTRSRQFSAMQRKRKLKGRWPGPASIGICDAGVRLCQTEPPASVAERV
jgi:hypothetical protein